MLHTRIFSAFCLVTILIGGLIAGCVALPGRTSARSLAQAAAKAVASPPGAPTLLPVSQIGERAWGTAVRGSYAYVVDETEGLHVIAMADPAHPREVGFYDTPGWAFGVAVSGHIAYVADGPQGLRVVDVADATHPMSVGTLATPGTAYAVVVSGHYAYIAAGSAGLDIVDVADPAHPVRVTTAALGYVQAITVARGYAYVSGTSGVQIVDVADPAHPRMAGRYNTPFTTHGVTIGGAYAYVAADNGLHILDIADPAHPALVGTFGLEKREQGQAVALVGHFAYVTYVKYDASDSDGAARGGLRVVDVSDPAHPVAAGAYATPGAAVGITSTGQYTYVAAWQGGMYIFPNP